MSEPFVDHQQAAAEDARRFRRTLAKVMTVQVVSLLLLWLLQRHYTA